MYACGSLQMGERCEVTPVSCKCSSIVDSAEEEFLNQVDMMICSVDSQPFSPAIPLIAQLAHEQVIMEAEMGIIHELVNMNFPSTRLTWLQLLLSARSINRETNIKPQIWYHSLAYLASNLLVDCCFGPLTPWKWQYSFLTGLELILVMNLPFLHVMLLPKPLSVDLQNASLTIMVFHTLLLLAKEFTPQP